MEKIEFGLDTTALSNIISGLALYANTITKNEEKREDVYWLEHLMRLCFNKRLKPNYKVIVTIIKEEKGVK